MFFCALLRLTFGHTCVRGAFAMSRRCICIYVMSMNIYRRIRHLVCIPSCISDGRKTNVERDCVDLQERFSPSIRDFFYRLVVITMPPEERERKRRIQSTRRDDDSSFFCFFFSLSFNEIYCSMFFYSLSFSLDEFRFVYLVKGHQSREKDECYSPFLFILSMI